MKTHCTTNHLFPGGLLFFFLLISAYAQAQTEQDNANVQPWIDITLFNEFSNKIEFYGDGGYRHIFGVDFPWDRYYVRPAVKYSPVPWIGIRGGFALFYTDHRMIPNTLELRPWQGVSFGWPKFRHIRFFHYFRLEQRIIYKTDNWDHSFANRFRYQFSSRIRPNPDKAVKYIYLPVFWEIFAQKKQKEDEIYELFGNENRIGMGVGYTVNKRWSAQFMFIFQRSRYEVGNFKTSDFLLRLSIRHELVSDHDMERVEDQ